MTTNATQPATREVTLSEADLAFCEKYQIDPKVFLETRKKELAGGGIEPAGPRGG